MKKTIHVHVIEQPARTRDSGGEGRWVTINGAHVHIGEGGKIDKGPKELVGKSEHGAHAEAHLSKGNGHKAAAEGKGEAHGDTPHHKRAAAAHYAAAHEHEQADHHAEAGDLKAARVSANKAAGHNSTAENHEAHLGKSKGTAPFEMPASHQGLHSDAGDDVKGSEKHAAEHNRLLNLYHTSKADWERNAVNRQIQNNATAAVQHRAQGLHHMATSASERAKRTNAPADHVMAMQHITNAIDAHGKAGGVGYAAKQAELEKLKKEHAKGAGIASVSPMKKLAQTDAAAHHRAQANAHRKPVGPLAQPDHKMADLHDEKAGHHEAQANGEDRSEQIKDVSARINQHQADALNNPPKKQSKAAAEREARASLNKKRASGGYDSKSGNGLDEIAKRAAKRAAESAADQDPKHKQ